MSTLAWAATMAGSVYLGMGATVAIVCPAPPPKGYRLRGYLLYVLLWPLLMLVR